VSAGPTIAIFDMDGTLTRADTFLAYLKFVLAKRRHRTGNCLALPLAVAQYRCGFRSRDWLKQEFVRAVLAGCSKAEADGWTHDFVERYGNQFLKPGAARTLHWHRRRDHRLIIATASLDLYTAFLAQLWGVGEFVSTRLEWQSGQITGRLDGPNLRGEAKLAAVKELLGKPARKNAKTVAYSDDHSDLPLLRFADRGFAVDPTRQLAARANREGLRIVSWKHPRGPRASMQGHPIRRVQAA
jgi:HAD superfamily hydrolase (TIGR01490 family)